MRHAVHVSAPLRLPRMCGSCRSPGHREPVGAAATTPTNVARAYVQTAEGNVYTTSSTDPRVGLALQENRCPDDRHRFASSMEQFL